MPGQVIKRADKTYLIRVFLGRIAGRRRYLNETFHGTKKKADERLTKILRDRDTGTLVEPTSITLSEFLKDWLDGSAKTRVRPRTLQFYRELTDRYLTPTLGEWPISRITPLDVQTLYAKLLDRKLSPRTVRHAHGVLRSALNQAVKWRMIANNPTLVVDLPRNRKREMKALSPEEAMKFLKHAAADRLSTLFAVAITTGMRPGEYMALRWSDVDLKKGIVVVRRALVRTKDGVCSFDEPKTALGSRNIPLPASVTKALKAHKEEQDAEKAVRLEKKLRYDDQDLIFATPSGEPLELRNLANRHFKPIAKAAGLPETLRLYDLRHSCATLLLSQGEHPKVVSERLGHASVTLTLDTYSHVLPNMQQQAAERLEGVLFRKRGRSEGARSSRRSDKRHSPRLSS